MENEFFFKIKGYIEEHTILHKYFKRLTTITTIGGKVGSNLLTPFHYYQSANRSEKYSRAGSVVYK